MLVSLLIDMRRKGCYVEIIVLILCEISSVGDALMYIWIKILVQGEHATCVVLGCSLSLYLTFVRRNCYADDLVLNDHVVPLMN